MKNFARVLRLCVSLALIFALGGCQHDGPVGSGPQGSDIKSPAVPMAYIPPDMNVEEVMLPPGDGTKRLQPVTREFIEANRGGQISCSQSYLDMGGSLVTRTATLVIPPGSLTMDTPISMMFDTTHMAVIFEPHGLLFLNYVTLSFDVRGIVKPDSGLNFFYFDESRGYVEKIPCRDLIIDGSQGTISVLDAQLKHFSRYGFGR